MAKSQRPARSKPPVVLVFGEDDNDQQSIKELVQALCPDAPPVAKRRTPLVLVKDQTDAEARKNATKAGAQVAAASVRNTVQAVIAHQDCDAVEPAHTALAARIQATWGATLSCPVIPAVPAFEMEAWWFLWPRAVARVVHAWRTLPAGRRNVGMIHDAKGALKRELRPATRQKPRDYTESDSPEIARHVRELGIVDQPVATSRSFEAFRDAVRSQLCPPATAT